MLAWTCLWISMFHLFINVFHSAQYYLPAKYTMSVAGPSTKPVKPLYCGVCSLPAEYCEFGPSFSKCKSWLEDKDEAAYERLWGEGQSLIYLYKSRADVQGPFLLAWEPYLLRSRRS